MAPSQTTEERRAPPGPQAETGQTIRPRQYHHEGGAEIGGAVGGTGPSLRGGARHSAVGGTGPSLRMSGILNLPDQSYLIHFFYLINCFFYCFLRIRK